LWSSIKAARWYVLWTLLLFTFFLVVYFPAQFALKLAEGAVSSLPVRISSVSGTLWQGTGLVSFQKHQIDIDWSLNGWSLLTMQPEINLHAKTGKTTEVSGIVSVSDSMATLKDLTGALDVSLLNPYLKAQRVSGQGVVKFYDLSLEFNHQENQIVSTNGRLLWQGAQATYPGPKGIETVTLPDIAGRLSDTDKGAELDVMSGQDGSKLASVFVMNQGWAGIKVRKRSVDLVGQTWVGNQKPDDVIFQLREKLW